MLLTTPCYIPVLTSSAGSCLTAANWQEVGVTTVSYYLDSLLLKPGYDLLMKTKNFAAWGWNGSVILNASNLRANKEGIVNLVSPYDGSKIKLSVAKLIELMHHLNPQAVILPPNITHDVPTLWNNWNEAIIPFITAEEALLIAPPMPYGVYFNVDDSSPQADFFEQLDKWSHIPRYVRGKVSIELLHTLKNSGVAFIESDEPVHQAMKGIVWNAAGAIKITDEVIAKQFEPIDSNCSCPTCAQQFTKAYLHHLLLHTPLLAQRLLMQHNVHYVIT